MKDIHTYDFTGKRALIRVDFNVPLSKDTLEVIDNTRIRAANPTIKHILDKGGSVVLMSHLGRPKENNEARFSLKNIVAHSSNILGVDIKFGGDCVGEEAFKMSAALQPGEVMLLENVRYYKQENTS